MLKRLETGQASTKAVRYLKQLMKSIKFNKRLYRQFKLETSYNPITNNSTRQNNYYQMFKRALMCSLTINDQQQRYLELRKCPINSNYQVTIQDTYDFLKQFLIITKDTKSNKATLKQVITAIDFLQHYYDEATKTYARNQTFLIALQSSRYVYEEQYTTNNRTPIY